MKNIAIIGASRMAQFHLKAFSDIDDVNIIGIASTNKGKVRRDDLANEYNISFSTSNYQDFLKIKDLHGVIIASKIDNQFDIALEFIKAGLNVLLEKPAGLTSEQAKDLIKAKNKSDVIVVVGLQKKLSQIFQDAKKFIDENGGLSSIVINAPERFDDIKAKNKFSDLVLSNWTVANGIHCIDFFNFFGGKVTHVNSHAKKIHGEDIHPNSIHSMITFSSGCIGHYISNWSSPGGYSLELYGKNFKVSISPLEKGIINIKDSEDIPLQLSEDDKKFKPGLMQQNKMFVELIDNQKITNYNSLESYLLTINLIENILLK